jgi:hypothetical protein
LFHGFIPADSKKRGAHLGGLYISVWQRFVVAHQVWYPPNDMETARRISALYGTTRRPNRSFN